MKKLKNKYVLIFFMVNFILPIHGQYLPKDDAKLNYNQIYFEYPFNKNAKFYKLYIAFDSTENKADFKTYHFNTYIDKTAATRVEGLEFGKNYKWYIETNLKSGEKINSGVHYFSILGTAYTDTNYYKRIITYKYLKNKGNGVIWCDLSHCAYDRFGNLVWFMPMENVEYSENTRVRDLKFENDGTITFIKNPNAIHTTIDLHEIWRAPLAGENISKFKNGYHHSFQKLENGNYMVLAYDYVELEKTEKNDTTTNNVELVNLIEFNNEKKIVWIWEMRDHFPLDILAIPKENGRSIINAHANSFSIDKDGEFVYIGYRDISRVIKINKKTKKIEASYGKKLNTADSLINEIAFFRSQHDAKILPNNDIMVINNNDVQLGKISSIEIFRQPNSKKEKVESVWGYNFNFDSFNNGKSLKFGNVKILENGNYLVNTGSGNRIFEITKNKKILWDMMLYIFDYKKKSWVNAGPYRIDYSSSLYPYYFSLSTPELTQKKVSLTIFNEGDYKDVYQCELFDETGKIRLAAKKTSYINSEGKLTVNFNVENLRKFTLKIQSIKSGVVKELIN